MLIFLVGAFVATACDGSPADPTPTSSSATATATATTSAPAVTVSFRACHRRSDGSVALVLRFESPDPSALGGYPGEVGIDVQVTDPATWATTGEAPEVRAGLQRRVRPLRVPPDEAPPQELTLRASVVPIEDPTRILAENDITVFVPASSCENT